MANSGIDKLSHLPELILLHILSFLPIETAHSTCLLSKRWQYLWTLVPTFDFDESRSHQTSKVPNGKGFAKFVTKALLRRRGRIFRRLRLKCISSHDHSDDLDSWVSLALAQNVQELDLDLNLDCSYHIPRSFRFHCTQQSCKTLVVLKLRSVLICGRLDKVSFPVLKIFHLQLPKFVMSYECLPEIKFLPSGFPVLEELVIKKFGFDIFDVEIHLPKLRYLAIDIDCRYGLVRIDCPALTHLVINDKNSRECRLENLLSLVEANIDLGRQNFFKFGKNECETYGRSVMSMVRAISNVRILKLSPRTMKEIYISSSYSLLRGDDIPVFHNLVQVELPFMGCAWEITILMLQKFENIECLTLCCQGMDHRGVDKESNQQSHVPNCLSSRLTTFCLRGFEGTSDEMNVTRYTLKNSLVLKKMTILFSSSLSLKDGLHIRKELCKYPRGSKGCQLEFRHVEEDEVV